MKTGYEKLLEMKKETMIITTNQYKKALIIIQRYQELMRCERIQLYGLEKANRLEIFKDVTPETFIYDSNISTRLCCGIKIALDKGDIEMHSLKIKDLSDISLSNLYKLRNVGKKSIEELQDLCQCAGITLK